MDRRTDPERGWGTEVGRVGTDDPDIRNLILHMHSGVDPIVMLGG